MREHSHKTTYFKPLLVKKFSELSRQLLTRMWGGICRADRHRQYSPANKVGRVCCGTCRIQLQRPPVLRQNPLPFARKVSRTRCTASGKRHLPQILPFPSTGPHSFFAYSVNSPMIQIVYRLQGGVFCTLRRILSPNCLL